MQLEQLYCFGKPGRDPRGRTVTIAFLALCHSESDGQAGDDAAAIQWFGISALPPLAFDHQEIIQKALQKLMLI